MRILEPKTVLLDAIQDGEQPLGMMVSSTDPAITDILGGAGYTFVIIDMEHGPIGLETAAHHVRAAEAHGMIPMVRVADETAHTIGRCLDIGCQGVIVPHVESPDVARQAVSATRFAPRGVRGMCPSSHAAGYKGGDTTPFVSNAENETIVGVIIESRAGVANAHEIASVDGVDIVFFGPGDLSYELGVVGAGWDSTEIQTAWTEVLTATHQAGKTVMGITLADTSEARITALFADGADLVCVYMDLLLIQAYLAGLKNATAIAPR